MTHPAVTRWLPQKARPVLTGDQLIAKYLERYSDIVQSDPVSRADAEYSPEHFRVFLQCLGFSLLWLSQMPTVIAGLRKDGAQLKLQENRAAMRDLVNELERDVGRRV